MQAAAAFLSGKGISFGMKESVSCIYDLNCLQILLSYLKVAEGMGEGGDYYRIINRPLRYINREALVGEGDPLNNAERYYLTHSDLKNRTSRIANLNQLRADLKFLREHSLFLDIRYLLNKLHLEEEFLNDNPFGSPEDLKQILSWFLEDSRRFDSLPEWLEAQTQYRKALQTEQKSGSRISLMTVHASKGLEFDQVFLPDCNEGMYPHGRMQEQKIIEEERRVFYVAMTRARNELQILYLTGSKDRPKQRSRFLEGLIPKQQNAM
jgi:DNA helicase-2/ATP-dependent DNA helicase PcrA